MTSYAFLGGAFDPIHLGHMSILTEVANRINFAKISILPYNISPTNKTLVATTAKRLTMARLALTSMNNQGLPKLGIEEVDTQSDSPAYTYDSLANLRDIYGAKCHISFIMGDDCYATLNSWHRWDELCGLANLLIINRDNKHLHPAVLDHERHCTLMDLSNSSAQAEFLAQSCGCIGKLELPPVQISSSVIRHRLSIDEDVSDYLMPSVIDYIKKNNLYA